MGSLSTRFSDRVLRSASGQSAVSKGLGGENRTGYTLREAVNRASGPALDAWVIPGEIPESSHESRLKILADESDVKTDEERDLDKKAVEKRIEEDKPVVVEILKEVDDEFIKEYKPAPLGVSVAGKNGAIYNLYTDKIDVNNPKIPDKYRHHFFSDSGFPSFRFTALLCWESDSSYSSVTASLDWYSRRPGNADYSEDPPGRMREFMDTVSLRVPKTAPKGKEGDLSDRKGCLVACDNAAGKAVVKGYSWRVVGRVVFEKDGKIHTHKHVATITLLEDESSGKLTPDVDYEFSVPVR